MAGAATAPLGADAHGRIAAVTRTDAPRARAVSEWPTAGSWRPSPTSTRTGGCSTLTDGLTYRTTFLAESQGVAGAAVNDTAFVDDKLREYVEALLPYAEAAALIALLLLALRPRLAEFR